jgi:hypothetical protein
VAAPLTHFFGHVHASGGFPLIAVPPGITFGLDGNVTVDLDANDDGRLLGGIGNPTQFFRGDLFQGAAAAVEAVFRDFNLGANGTLQASFSYQGFDFSMPLGGGAVVYNGDQQGLWVKAVRGSEGNPWAGTPFAVLNFGQSDFLEGTVFRNGQFSLKVGSRYDLGPARLSYAFTLTQAGITADIAGSVKFGITYNGSGATVRADLTGRLTITYNTALKRLEYSGTLSATGKLILLSRTSSVSVSATVTTRRLKFVFGNGIGTKTFDLP